MKNNKTVFGCAEIFDSMSEGVYIVDVNTHELLFLNKTIRNLLHVTNYEKKKCYRILQGQKSPCGFCSIPKLRNGDVHIWNFTNLLLHREYELKDIPIVFQGHEAMLEIAFDITKQVEEKKQQEYALRLEQQLLQDIKILNGSKPLDWRIHELFKDLGNYLQADRIYIFEFMGTKMNNTYEWCNLGVGPQIQNLQDVSVSSINRWLPYLERHETVEVKDIETIRTIAPEEYAIMAPQNIQSYIEAPLVIRDKVAGFIGFDNPPTDKFEHLRTVLFSLAYFVSAAMEREQQDKEQQQYMIELKQAKQRADKANQAKSNFLNSMSHDIRTPLNGILGLTYLARQQQLNQELQEIFSGIEISSQFLLGLVNDILDVGRLESNKLTLHPEPLDINDFSSYIEAVIRPMCQGKNQKLIFKIDMPQNYYTFNDKLRVAQAAYNLFNNASKFTPEGGTIKCTITGKLQPGNHKIAVHTEISDNGIGMSESFQKVMFDKFTQEQRDDNNVSRGSGLGMTIVKKILELMGATITVESKLGCGTTFFVDVEVPCVPKEQIQKQIVTSDMQLSLEEKLLEGRHILLCEDHPLNQKIMKKILERKGMLVETADNRQSGLENFEHSAIGYYDAILMDIRMPVMDGLTATVKMRQLQRQDAGKVPIIAISANAFPQDIRDCLKAGMTGHLAKPVQPEKLYKKLAQAFSQSS